MNAKSAPATVAEPPPVGTASKPPRVSPPPSRSSRRSARVFFFFSLAILVAGLGSLLFADLLWRIGWSPTRFVLLALFTVLFLMASIGCMHAVYGFFLRRFGRQPNAQFGDYQSRSIEDTSTALVFPIFNEDAVRVFEGVRAVHDSLKRTGDLARFDFFILSDSTNPDKWIDEERRWFALARDLGALGRIHYRRRLLNEGKKSGNIRDFLRTWGRRYRYFVVFDADSVMSGSTIVDLVKIMETNPGIGLLQSIPVLVNARSLFARMQQFANRLYGPLFTEGLNYWSQDGGNYWGHNAIIRVEPFMQFCDLPKLPGAKPFGGQILSHDFVEAALLRKENWQVWMAPDLAGSYEEGPPAIIENAQRDRRWCQGNLQHFLVLFARGLPGGSRMHLVFGILGYLAGPLWLATLSISTYLLWDREQSGLSEVVVGAFTPIIRLDRTGHALLVFGLVMAVLFLPKLLSLLDLAFDAPRRRAFGGLGAATVGAISETLFSTLHAPLQMLFHSKFVVAALFGATVHWTTQTRGGDGTDWATAARQHAGHTVLGLGWGSFVWWLDPGSFWWFVPVLLGMAFSIPLSVLTSRESLGQRLRRAGLFLTPEETGPPLELASLDQSGGPTVRSHDGLREAVLDPYVNAIHVTLLREKQANPENTRSFESMGVGSASIRAWADRLLTEGPTSLKENECLSILSDPEAMLRLHREVWTRPPEALAPWWRIESGAKEAKELGS